MSYVTANHFLRSGNSIHPAEGRAGGGLCFQISVNMRTEILHNGRGIWRIGADGRIMTTGGRRAEREWTTRRRLAPHHHGHSWITPVLEEHCGVQFYRMTSRKKKQPKITKIFSVIAWLWVLNLERVSGSYLKETEVSRCQPAQPDDHVWCEVWWREGRTGVALLMEREMKWNGKSQFSNGDIWKRENKLDTSDSHFGIISPIVQLPVTWEQRTVEISSNLIKGIWPMPERTSPACRHGTSRRFAHSRTIHVWNYFKDKNYFWGNPK